MKTEPVHVLRIYAVGSEVLLDTTVNARITAVLIREGSVSYEVVWWNDRCRVEAVVYEWEIKPDNDKTRVARIDPIL